ncbi:unnamed protein product [Linum tenue]|uniref:Retrotransposon Copia-like N-terminal domain-containing protein n=1 Tax=Linum tenue TaxID=586396 RepID=A0AAV0J0M4_9ROSI|nr:unnamed protein product [Linum tenue]
MSDLQTSALKNEQNREESSIVKTMKREEAASAYSLHNSDNPGQMFVSDPLTDQNYGEWVSDMTNSLLAKHKMGFVDGSIQKPAEGDEYLGAWIQCDAMVKGWLKTAMDKEVRTSVRYAKTAREIWVDLQERFGKGSAPRAYELRRAISLLQQEKLTVSAYYTKLRGLWEESNSITPQPTCVCNRCTCGLEKRVREISENARVFDFLMGLADVFSTVRSQALNVKPTPTLGEVYHMVAEDEQQRNISASRKLMVEAAAYQVNATTRDGGERRNDGKEQLKCTHCNKLGHTKERCYELIGYPPKGGRPGYKGNRLKYDHKSGPKAAHVTEVEGSPIPGLSVDQYHQLVRFLSGGSSSKASSSGEPAVNMAGLTLEEADWNG